MAQGEYHITEMFEEEVARYTGAPHAVAVDNCSNAIFLALLADARRRGIPDWRDIMISVPARTYPSVPCEVIHAGGQVEFQKGKRAQGAYQLYPTHVWDSSLRFTAGMYLPGMLMCLSFTGPFKRLKLGKGGIILTDDVDVRDWLRKARFSGRGECSYHEDEFHMLGWNFYMMPELAARGLMMMRGFWRDGKPLEFPDIEVEYPDLSQFKVYSNHE